jgi:L-lactate dehydrogenase (cytochrome)
MTDPSPFRHILALQDLEAPARRLLPRSVFGFAAGGSETGATLEANAAAYAEWSFRPRILVDVTQRRTETMLFGRRYTAPFGIAPMGGACMFRREGDLLLALAAEKAGIGFMLSGASSVPLERIRAEAPGSWFQAYFPTGRESVAALVDRVAQAGYTVLTVTVDVAVPANRENNLRNGWSMPLRLTPRLIADTMAHPRWLLGTALPGYFGTVPHFENFEAERGAPMFGRSSAGTARSTTLDWKDLEFIRARWPGKLVIKGVLSPEDARLARSEGADGIVVSNHGGRQLDHAAATLRALPDVVAASGDMVVMLDGGIRRGTDVLKALALGARFVFVGRPFLYAAAIGGEAAITHAIGLLKDEIARDLGLLGCPDPALLHPGFLVPSRVR